MGSKSQTIGYWYELAWHDGLSVGPLDAYLELRGGTKPAWTGRLTASATVSINEENLWGGEKDQGGIVGSMAVMFGEASQMPNAYLVNAFGVQTVAWRGVATVAFEGGKWGANNPYAQKRSHKVERIKKGWDGDACWYAAKAAILLVGSTPAGEGSDIRWMGSGGFGLIRPLSYDGTWTGAGDVAIDYGLGGIVRIGSTLFSVGYGSTNIQVADISAPTVFTAGAAKPTMDNEGF
ncbi:MAG: hypothetical protein ACOH2M_23315, partial [Cypionkella sp.]